MTESNTIPEADSALVAEVVTCCMDAIGEVKKAYEENLRLQDKVNLLEKSASELKSKVVEVDEEQARLTVRNLVASSFLDSVHAEKLASELTQNPNVALSLIQRFIEISAPPFSEGQGVNKSATEDTQVLGDPDGWARILSKGA